MKEIILGIFCGVLIATCMRYVPIFHGPNSNIVKFKKFEDDKGCYNLSPYPVTCPIKFQNFKNED